jgi:hypothetical protein
MGPCHNSMARSRVVDGKDGLQMWTVAANMLNKQSRTADKECSSSLCVERWLKAPHHKKTHIL